MSFETLQPFLNHQNEKVRVAAIKSLRFSPEDEGVQFISDSFLKFSPREADAAITAISFWPREKQYITLLVNIYTKFDSDNIRLKILSTLKKFRDISTKTYLSEALERLRNETKSDSLIRIIEEML